jgi:hypothetical protein
VIFGSTANHVVRQAACPVLVVRETKSARAAPEVREAVGAAVDVAKGGKR